MSEITYHVSTKNNIDIEDEEVHILSDNKYLGPGFFIITTNKHFEITKFIKLVICSSNDLFPHFKVRAYKKDSPYTEYSYLSLTIPTTSIIYPALLRLARATNEEKLYTVDYQKEGENNLSFTIKPDAITINLFKDTNKIKRHTSFIDITLADNYKCKCMRNIFAFYNELLRLPIEGVDEKDIKKLIHLK